MTLATIAALPLLVAAIVTALLCGAVRSADRSAGWRWELDGPKNRPGPRRCGSERGVISVELVIMAPLIVGFVLALWGAGRLSTARGQVDDAAYAAARAASLDPTDAVGTGHSAAAAALASRGRSCAKLSVSIDAAGLHPGGEVTAHVTCVADLSDLVGFGLPGSRLYKSTAVVPIEVYRRP